MTEQMIEIIDGILLIRADIVKKKKKKERKEKKGKEKEKDPPSSHPSTKIPGPPL